MGYRSIYDYDEELEHSLGEWKDKATKYIDKFIGPNGKMVYIYNKAKAGYSIGKNTGKEYYLNGAAGKIGNAFGRASRAVGNGMNDLRNRASEGYAEARKQAKNFATGFNNGRAGANYALTNAGRVGNTLGRVVNNPGRAIGNAAKAAGRGARNAYTSAKEFIFEKTGRNKRLTKYSGGKGAR